MEFDHRLGEKKLFNIGDGKWRSQKQLIAEIAKCDVVCCWCHSKREESRGRVHGAGRHPCPNVAKRPFLIPMPPPGPTHDVSSRP